MMKHGDAYTNEKGEVIQEFEGFCVDLAEQIAEWVGFEYIMRPVKDNKYGAKLPNGTWNGMVGELIRHVSHTRTHVSRLLFEPGVRFSKKNLKSNLR